MLQNIFRSKTLEFYYDISDKTTYLLQIYTTCTATILVFFRYMSKCTFSATYESRLQPKVGPLDRGH